MKWSIAPVMTGLCWCASIQLSMANTAPPLPAAFGTVPAFFAPSISPDGNSLAWGDVSGAAPQVVLFDVGTHTYKRRMQLEPAVRLRDLGWADNETVLMNVSITLGSRVLGEGRVEEYRTIAADIDNNLAGRTLLMTGGERAAVTGAMLIGRRADRSKKILMSTLDLRAERGGVAPEIDRSRLLSLFEVDTRTGKGTVLIEGTPDTREWATDVTGRYFARKQKDPLNGSFTLQLQEGSSWRDVYHGPSDLNMISISPDGRSLMVYGRITGQTLKVWALPADGSPPQAFIDGGDQDVIEVRTHDFTAMPYMAQLEGSEPRTVWVNTPLQAQHDSLVHTFGGRAVNIVSYSETGNRVVAMVSSASSPAVYYLVDFQTKKADIIGEEYPGLAQTQLGEVRTISYKARDGLEIPAYLTLPPGREAKNLPLIILPHGGLEGRDRPEFSWLAQFLATRGYAVLMPQFRGSSGFGFTFRHAGDGQWGGQMQDDLSDGVAAMVSQTIADPKRICIVGADYGGYAALAGAAFTPDLYKCAVSINGISDLQEMLAYIHGSHPHKIALWDEKIGRLSDPNTAAKSPVHAASRVTIPILLMHSQNDSFIPVQQSEDMARSLKQAGKAVTVVELSGEDHWLSRSESRTHMLEEIGKFLAANL